MRLACIYDDTEKEEEEEQQQQQSCARKILPGLREPSSLKAENENERISTIRTKNTHTKKKKTRHQTEAYNERTVNADCIVKVKLTQHWGVLPVPQSRFNVPIKVLHRRCLKHQSTCCFLNSQCVKYQSRYCFYSSEYLKY